MLSYIKGKLESLDVTVQEDEYGNIYVTKGTAKTYPCVVAHTDTVHDILEDVNIFRTNDTLFAFNPEKRAQCGIGGDDKVGVYITLQLLEDIPILKAVFFKDEEIGCKGSSFSIQNHKDWYKDCGFVLMADRRGNKEIITLSGGVIIASPDFLEACDPLFEKYGYTDAAGVFTDVDVLTVGGIGVSTVNFSCGYYEPHSPKEIVSISDVNRCYNLMYDIIIEHGDKTFAYKAKVPSYKTTHKKEERRIFNNLISDIYKVGATSSLNKRQLKIFPPFVFGRHPEKYTQFAEHDIIKGDKKVYKYVGTKALVLTGESICNRCKNSTVENVYFLPYEGRMYCTICNDYVNDAQVPMLLQHLEVEDNETTFVYSLYSAGWLPKEEAKWNQRITSWVSTELPF
jgi:hypothetical protein